MDGYKNRVFYILFVVVNNVDECISTIIGKLSVIVDIHIRLFTIRSSLLHNNIVFYYLLSF